MAYFYVFIFTLLVSCITIPFAGSRAKGILALFTLIILAGISSIIAIEALSGQNLILSIQGSAVTNEIKLVVDALSAWFIIVINFTFLTGALYGIKYMQVYHEFESRLSLHWISFILTYAGMLSVCVLQNFIAFLFAWEIMTLGAFFMVIFEGHQQKTIKAGLNYLIQSHLAVLVLTIAFIWIHAETGTFDFSGISIFGSEQSPIASLAVLLLFFIGFGIKAGFVPFHTWLPHAHPVAPSHVSGIMSGVLIKIGIYGILRMVLTLNVNYLITGYLILIVSIISGIYGVMLAILQHDLKKLLAYHSIENIGIIGIGIGLACIGIGRDNHVLAALGFAGALLHTLNHSLFKSLLFYSAGNVYQAVHSMHIDSLGGLLKKMPHTAFLFLVAALAICGLPPFNGFISELIIYGGLFKGITTENFPLLLVFVFGVFGLSLIGGLAILCFTKAFGIVFLGNPRHQLHFKPVENQWLRLAPMYLIVILMLAIGVFPSAFMGMLSAPLAQLDPQMAVYGFSSESGSIGLAANIGIYTFGFLVLSGLIYLIRSKFLLNQKSTTDVTWGCGYVGDPGKMQYSASSFVRNYRKLIEPVFEIQKHQKEVGGIIPQKAAHHTHVADKTEVYLINMPLRKFRHFLGLFSFLQNGRLQMYILYGMLFVTLLIGIPFFAHLLRILLNTLNTM